MSSPVVERWKREMYTPSSSVGRKCQAVSSSASRAQPSAGVSPGSRWPAGLLMRRPSEVSSSIMRKRPSRSMTAATVTLGRQRLSMAHYLVLLQNGGPSGTADSMLRTVAALLATFAALAAAAQSSLPAIQAPPAPANPYGLGALWAQGDIVSRTTIVLLVLMSLASWYVLVAKLLAQSRMGGHGRVANQQFWKADTVQQGAEALQPGSPYRFIAQSAIEATRKHDGLIGKVDLNTWVAQSIERAVG